MITVTIDRAGAVLLRDLLARQTVTVGDPDAEQIVAVAVSALLALDLALQEDD